MLGSPRPAQPALNGTYKLYSIISIKQAIFIGDTFFNHFQVLPSPYSCPSLRISSPYALQAAVSTPSRPSALVAAAPAGSALTVASAAVMLWF